MLLTSFQPFSTCSILLLFLVIHSTWNRHQEMVICIQDEQCKIYLYTFIVCLANIMIVVFFSLNCLASYKITVASKILCPHLLLIYTCSAFPCWHVVVLSCFGVPLYCINHKSKMWSLSALLCPGANNAVKTALITFHLLSTCMSLECDLINMLHWLLYMCSSVFWIGCYIQREIFCVYNFKSFLSVLNYFSIKREIIHDLQGALVIKPINKILRDLLYYNLLFLFSLIVFYVV